LMKGSGERRNFTASPKFESWSGRAGQLLKSSRPAGGRTAPIHTNYPSDCWSMTQHEARRRSTVGTCQNGVRVWSNRSRFVSVASRLRWNCPSKKRTAFDDMHLTSSNTNGCFPRRPLAAEHLAFHPPRGETCSAVPKTPKHWLRRRHLFQCEKGELKLAMGIVKWFNPTKRCGFIRPDDGGPTLSSTSQRSRRGVTQRWPKARALATS
jgi:hypothetical protein